MPDTNTSTPDGKEPVRFIPTDHARPPLKSGMALCLSGGGYRAMLFHLGPLIRLNEAGLLEGIKRISSVSGGSITSGVLGMKWKNLNFVGNIAQNLDTEVVSYVRKLADKTIDAEAVLGGILFGTISEKIEKEYDEILFKGGLLGDLPSDTEGPRFVINATNVQSGALFRFSRPFMADYLVGVVKNPKVKLAKAVTASSAFPPILSPCILNLNPTDFTPDPTCPLQKVPFTSTVVLSDGGVYDNMGIETAWKGYQTILVSDAGAKLQPEANPKHDWLLHSYRIFDIVDNQVRSLRKRQIIQAFEDSSGLHNGTYWGINSHVKDYGLEDAIVCDENHTAELASTPTRLAKLDPGYQERLINWGYAICDTAIRRHVDPKLPKGSIPFPGSPI